MQFQRRQLCWRLYNLVTYSFRSCISNWSESATLTLTAAKYVLLNTNPGKMILVSTLSDVTGLEREREWERERERERKKKKALQRKWTEVPTICLLLSTLLISIRIFLNTRIYIKIWYLTMWTRIRLNKCNTEKDMTASYYVTH